jgi:hypothetical protein
VALFAKRGKYQTIRWGAVRYRGDAAGGRAPRPTLIEKVAQRKTVNPSHHAAFCRERARLDVEEAVVAARGGPDRGSLSVVRG